MLLLKHHWYGAQVQGRALFPGSGLFEVAAAASGMMASCDALPQATAKLLLLSHIAVMAPLALVAGGAAQLLVCSVDTRCSQTPPHSYCLGNIGDTRTLTAHSLHSGA